MTEPLIFACECCGMEEYRPEGFGLPMGWDKRPVAGGEVLLCEDCLTPSNHLFKAPPAPAVAATKTRGAPIRRDHDAPETQILLRSGVYVDLADPDCARITIRDIASGLARTCRFSGQTTRFYSVAEHSVLCSQIVPPEHAYAALMHDAAEAIIGDVTRPLKSLLPDYRRIEAQLEERLFAKFGVTIHPAVIKRADMQVLMAERAALMPADGMRWPVLDGITPILPPERIECWGPDEAERRFLERWNHLWPTDAWIAERAAA